MWLKCPVCGNVYASGYDEHGSWRDEGSECQPPDIMERTFARVHHGACDGRLERFAPPHPVSRYCPRCCNIYSGDSVTCPTCYYLSQSIPR